MLAKCRAVQNPGERRDAAVIAVFRAAGIRLSEMAAIRHDPGDPAGSDLDLQAREISIRGKGGKDRIVRVTHQAARAVDRYLRVRARHPQVWRSQLWLGVHGRGPLTAAGIYQLIGRGSPPNCRPSGPMRWSTPPPPSASTAFTCQPQT